MRGQIRKIIVFLSLVLLVALFQFAVTLLSKKVVLRLNDLNFKINRYKELNSKYPEKLEELLAKDALPDPKDLEFLSDCNHNPTASLEGFGYCHYASNNNGSSYVIVVRMKNGFFTKRYSSEEDSFYDDDGLN